jgi:hypothetical protein
VRGEEVEGVVTPVVDRAVIEQVLLGNESVYGKQLDGGDPEVREIARHCGVGQTGIGSA